MNKGTLDLYLASITIESMSRDIQEAEWSRGGDYVGADDKAKHMCMIYYYSYSNFFGAKTRSEANIFCKEEVKKLREKGYHVRKTYFNISKVLEAKGRKISVSS